MNNLGLILIVLAIPIYYWLALISWNVAQMRREMSDRAATEGEEK